MSRRTLLRFLAALSVAWAATGMEARARTIYVNAGASGGPGDGASWRTAFRTIRQAVASAGAGDQVWVAAGHYRERVIMRDGVSLLGGFDGTETDGGQRDARAHLTVLDGESAGTVVTIPAGAAAVTLDGLTVRQGNSTMGMGSPPWWGAGIHSEGAGVVIAHCVIEDNDLSAYEDNPRAMGAGVYITGGPATLRNNVVRRNRLTVTQGLGLPQFGNLAEGDGAGIAVDNAHVVVANNLIHDNEIVITGIPSRVAPLGSGLFCEGASGEIVSNTLVGNVNRVAMYNFTTHGLGGAVHLRNPGGQLTFANNIVAFNDSGVERRSGTATLTHNNVYANGVDFNEGDPTGTDGNISADPLFANRAAGDYRLAPVSPSVDAGESRLAAGPADLDGRARILGQRIDMGAYETPLDAALTMGDAAGALRVAAGMAALSPGALARLDRDDGSGGDGAVDLRDTIAIVQMVVGR